MSDLFSLEDTIAAVSTPAGRSGIAIVRLSGPEAVALAGEVFSPAREGRGPARLPTYTLAYGHVVDGDEMVDEVLVTVMRAPHTYTRQDVVEINCHGGLVVARRVLELLLRSGARLAEPGEFTRRAFLLGRIDLAQAEAVADLVNARTELAARAATSQLAGHLSALVEGLRASLIDLLAYVEASIDFSAEGLELLTPEELARRLAALRGDLERLLARSAGGRVLREGLRCAIIGRPNVGKSSLMNALLRQHRVIVTDTPGTTRDVVEETADLRGLPVVLADTAGLREVEEEVERIGVDMARSRAREADLVLLVLDGSVPLAPEDLAALGEAEAEAARTIAVINKRDLEAAVAPGELPPALRDGAVRTSARTGEGLEDLERAIEAWVWRGGGRPAADEPVMTSVRQRAAVEEAVAAVRGAEEALGRGYTEEVVAHHLHQARRALGAVLGETTTEAILDTVFANFCIGK